MSRPVSLRSVAVNVIGIPAKMFLATLDASDLTLVIHTESVAIFIFLSLLSSVPSVLTHC